MTDRVDLTIEGMHCDHCEVTVGRALEDAGLLEVQVDWRRGVASGQDAGAFSSDRANHEVSAIGYRVASVETAGHGRQAQATESADYDLLIIGSGAAAFGAAIKARDLGGRVAMIEEGTVGGTCVNVGCVPSKTLLSAATAHWRAGHSPFAGIATSADAPDLARLLEQKDQLVGTMRQEKYIDLLEHYDIDLIHGRGRFTERGAVQVGDREIRASRFLIATGAEAWAPPIDGLQSLDYLTSTTALELTALPDDLIVVGGNAIGLELGQLFLHLGTRVTIVEALDRIAPFEEPEISVAIKEVLEHRGARVLVAANATAAGFSSERHWLDITVRGNTFRLEADQLLVATGRRARTDGLGLEEAGVDVDDRGRVIVDDGLATSNPAVYAAGDVTDHPQFVYVAALAGKIAAENALRQAGGAIDFRTMPRVTFTAPAIASVGLTEAQARASGIPTITSVLPLDAVPRAMVDHATDGLVKLVADEETGRLLGAHVLSEGAGDVIQAAVMALKYRATIDDIADTYHPYLTMAEALKLAAQGFGKDVRMLSCCAA